MSDRDAQIVSYLLGELNDDEREGLEQEFLRDHELRETMRAVEDDLVDDYVRGDLPVRRRAQFEARFLSQPQRRQKVELARALDRALTERRAKQTVVTTPPAERARRWWSELVVIPLFQGVPRYALAAAAIVVIGALAWFLGQQSTAPETTPTVAEGRLPAGRPEGKPLPTVAPPGREGREPGAPNLPRPPAIFAVTLAAGLTRDAAAATTITIPAATDIVRLQLPLESGDEYPGYRAELGGGGDARAWRSDVLRRSGGPGAQSVTLDLPRSILAPGKYELSLTGIEGNRGDVVGYYYFSVALK